MIVGTDLLKELKMDFSFSQGTITWDENTVPMKDFGMVSDPETTTAIYELAIESTIIKEAEARHKKILDADYSPVNIQEYMDGIPELNMA